MRASPTDGWTLGRVVVVGLIAIGVVGVVVADPPALLIANGFGPKHGESKITASSSAFGLSGQVRLQVRMPGELFDFPIEFSGTGEPPSYLWVKASDSSGVIEPRPLIGSTVKAPVLPGFYRLALVTATGRQIMDSVLVCVLVPFSTKMGATLNGYRIGRYKWEALGGDASPPPIGFLQVLPEDLELQLSAHLRLRAFVTHDNQEIWPKYVALDPRILDKIELVLTDLDVKDFEMPMDVSSGFRTPIYNRTVPRAAGDSRHQYGDAADLAIDVDGDGRVTYADAVAVARAVERVEQRHPELVGGLGLYGNHGTSPYVHIDVRGKPSRWRG
ncbi:MAG TPA: D-Ala-D-Ala carboxypeptidase family metallohydrolase [Candidatus Acidoferrales bacterium]|nr:D-Ala-D-Ala carboxypeptidase family metallohydrolase [Candidatus Acidoferrales bacterium]